MHYLKSGELVYPAAAMGIVHNPILNTQKFLNAGYEHIISTLVSPSGTVVFLGEQTERPCIYVWDCSFDPPILLKTIKQCLKDGVEMMAMSPSGRYLLAACIDEQRTYTIYDLYHDYALLYCDWLGNDEVCEIDFVTGLPKNKVKIYGSLVITLWLSDERLIVTGSSTANLLTEKGDTYVKLEIPLEKSPSSIILCAAVCPNGDVVFGTSAGEFLVWRESSRDQGTSLCSPKLHGCPIDALEILATGNSFFVIVGGKECKLTFLDEEYKVKMNFDIYSKIPNCLDGQIRAIASKHDQKSFAIGLISGEIYEITYK